MAAFELHSSAGRLTALYDEPSGQPPARGPRAAVVCHPHPTYGGRMDNKVVHAVAKRLAARGLGVVRFNFRGFGGSDGQHDGGRGEQDDARAAIDAAAALAATDATGGVLMCGYSFGAYVGLSAAVRDPRVAALVAIAPPVNHYDFRDLARAGKPLAVVYARADELVPARAVEEWIATCEPAPRVFPVDGAGHLFHRRLAPVRAAVDAFCDELAGARRQADDAWSPPQ